MVASFSPHREAGGTLHLPSPNGIHHHVTPSSAIKQLRRSLSRSPSKTSDFRLLSRPHSPSTKNTHYISSPLSPSRRVSQGNLFLVPVTSTPSPLAIPYPPSARITRPGIRRTGSFQPTRTRTTPASPVKRILSDSRDNGNVLLPKSIGEKGVDEQTHLQRSPIPISRSPELGPGENMTNQTSDNTLMQMPSSRIEKRRSGTFGSFTSTSSPLKRSDVIKSLEHTPLGSPSAKRRSLHGASCGQELNFFDSEHNMGSTTTADKPDNDTSVSSFVQTSSNFSVIPKRSSSLRKSTLQQRQSERSLFSRAKVGGENEPEPRPNSPMALRNRQRTSVDSQLFLPASRDGSSGPASQGVGSPRPLFTLHHTNNQPINNPQAAHPLSRTLTQSSSDSSLVDDSPTHESINKVECPRPILNFSKSLPAGSTRPIGPSQLRQESSTSSMESFATPENYKLVKPLPAAFMSTGLISKKNRNIDDVHNASITSQNMPDTPCKRSLNMFPGVHKPLPQRATEKASSNRHSSVTPWTPFSQQEHTATPNPGPFSKGMSIFGSSYGRPPLSRRGSFVSADGDEIPQSQSPSRNHDTQSTIDSDLPPTPTKQKFFPHGSHFSKTRPHRPSHSQTPSFDSLSGPSGPCCKLSFVEHSSPTMNEENDSDMDDSPSAGVAHNFKQRQFPVISSMPRSRLVQNLNSPSPHPRASFPMLSPIKCPQFRNAKFNPTLTASPLGNKSFRRDSPHTPQDNIIPPDPSGLSISAQGDQRANPHDLHSSALPATPTAPREYFAQLGKWQSLSLGPYNAPEVDSTLTSRFEKVELVGTGEFSQVYRVTEKQSTTPFGSPFPQSSFSQASEKLVRSASRAERVWAVKKSKQPYTGPKDRERRNHEVVALKALAGCDYIISYADSWEANNFLYIQTEFCEEGSLDVFLAQVGLKARLDDFRIWKILLELSLGLKHTHDSGFIHLDLKPANILITFEGVLKIADFGMASHWPAAAGIEGEGDREYIGPEVLMGHYDKPADIFALGLIVFETAGNVELPDNGASWQKLRNGDISDVPSLTWSLETSNVLRDASGNPLPEERSFEQLCSPISDDQQFGDPSFAVLHDGNGHIDSCHKHSPYSRSGELAEPPDFMVDATNEQSLDTIVRWMISPDPADRPTADQILQIYGVHWVERRRRAGATIYEGNWGPADEVLAEDAEMIDV
ncbi:mitosis inhibitor protein kinase SWE1 [Paracoccidioides lutzii Pb01]|uniref:Mitosis inhibitor protein kinase SWE1 n=1 Tax=Paracoccidioides lutzii (strain ATCC MYA-826 / Pb01) TaxID=502779 RepID=C1HCN4_PARBA|nr:mitosis inhibitor protein kinase SWE1 [Paracoccidioides lutzii Pb01]EEH38798.2 mitosis inhibitor protein kinase SWE1 [Paracoccidioides lutzii Pb01]